LEIQYFRVIEGAGHYEGSGYFVLGCSQRPDITTGHLINVVNEMKIETPKDLVIALIDLFPGFRNDWDEGESFGGIGQYNFHTVFMEIAPVCSDYLAMASPRKVEAFCAIINSFVASGGDMENAVSTCLLEHASQVGIAKTIKPHLSQVARAELR
jgi:hypothetical protein